MIFRKKPTKREQTLIEFMKLLSLEDGVKILGKYIQINGFLSEPAKHKIEQIVKEKSNDKYGVRTEESNK